MSKNMKKRMPLWAAVVLAAVFLAGCTKKEEPVFALEAAGMEETENAVKEDAIKEDTAKESAIKEDAAKEGAATKDADAAKEEIHAQEPSFAYVHICGAVAVPGVYKVKAGSRIYEAIALAGGLLPEACAEYTNQAQPVEDGMQIKIPTMQEVQEGAPDFLAPEGDGADSATDGLVNINAADKETLCTLPGIGEARAESILRYRQEHGAFQSIEDIMQVEGIKEKAYQKLKDKIKVR